MGKGTFTYEMFSVFKAYRLEVKLSSLKICRNNLTHFATLANTEQPVISTEKYINIIVSADN